MAAAFAPAAGPVAATAALTAPNQADFGDMDNPANYNAWNAANNTFVNQGTQPFIDWAHETDPAKQQSMLSGSPAGSIVGASDYGRPLYMGADGQVHQDSATGSIYGGGGAQQAIDASKGAMQATRTAWEQDQANQGQQFDRLAALAKAGIMGMAGAGAMNALGGLGAAGADASALDTLGVGLPDTATSIGGVGVGEGAGVGLGESGWTPGFEQTPTEVPAYQPDPSQFTDAPTGTPSGGGIMDSLKGLSPMDALKAAGNVASIAGLAGKLGTPTGANTQGAYGLTNPNWTPVAHSSGIAPRSFAASKGPAHSIAAIADNYDRHVAPMGIGDMGIVGGAASDDYSGALAQLLRKRGR